jgi:hypothetical protein
LIAGMKTMTRDEIAARRARAVRTAWILAVVVALIFTAFVLSGVLNT